MNNTFYHSMIMYDMTFLTFETSYTKNYKKGGQDTNQPIYLKFSIICEYIIYVLYIMSYTCYQPANLPQI